MPFTLVVAWPSQNSSNLYERQCAFYFLFMLKCVILMTSSVEGTFRQWCIESQSPGTDETTNRSLFVSCFYFMFSEYYYYYYIATWQKVG